MAQLIVSEWMTLDGVFDADTMQEWFTPFDSAAKKEYIRESIVNADALLVGRTTYEMLAAYWPHEMNDDNGPASKINSMEKFVVSSQLEKASWNNSTIIKEKVVEEVTKLKQQPGHEIQIEGSATLVQSLMKANLIDEYRFLVHPIIAGSGKRFFKDGMDANKLKLVKTKPLDLGVVLLCYQPG